MDPTTINALLLTLGAPGLVISIGTSASIWVKGRSAANVKNAEARKLNAEAEVIAATTARTREDTAGKLMSALTGALENGRGDLTACEQMRDELREELQVERAAREKLGRDCEQRERASADRIESLETALAAALTRIDELERRSPRAGGE